MVLQRKQNHRVRNKGGAMFTSKYRWMAAFGTSVACHAVVFVVIGAVVALFPSTPVDKGPIEVELV